MHDGKKDSRDMVLVTSFEVIRGEVDFFSQLVQSSDGALSIEVRTIQILLSPCVVTAFHEERHTGVCLRIGIFVSRVSCCVLYHAPPQADLPFPIIVVFILSRHPHLSLFLCLRGHWSWCLNGFGWVFYVTIVCSISFWTRPM